MQQQVTIKGSSLTHFKTGKLLNRLPGMNDIIEEAKKGKGAYQPYSQMKIYYNAILCDYFRSLTHLNCVKVIIDWYEPNWRRDVDNIVGGGTKFIMDSLVNCKIIKDDSQKYVKSITHNIYTDKENPRIEITLMEVL